MDLRKVTFLYEVDLFGWRASEITSLHQRNVIIFRHAFAARFAVSARLHMACETVPAGTSTNVRR